MGFVGKQTLITVIVPQIAMLRTKQGKETTHRSSVSSSGPPAGGSPKRRKKYLEKYFRFPIFF